MEDDDMFGQGTGEARDSISTLPRKIAIQVGVYIPLVLVFIKNLLSQSVFVLRIKIKRALALLFYARFRLLLSPP